MKNALLLGALLQDPIPAPEAIPSEPRLRNVRQLTFGGENAEAYLSFQGDRLVFQSTREGWPCDLIFTMDLEGKEIRRVSEARGRTTCGFFFPDGKRILFSSTHKASPDCPPRPDHSKGYVWALYDYDIYAAREDGSDLQVLSAAPGYDAEATISPDGKKIVFTSVRNGDLDLFTMNLDGSGLKQMTSEIGYDGGPFFSPDSREIVYRAYYPKDPKEVEEYRALLKQGVVRPSKMELFVMDAEGSTRRQITSNGAASFAPSWHPDGKRIIFASNLLDPKGRNFDLFLIQKDGSGLEQITRNPTFDGFPVFTKDGKHLVFCSNRLGKTRGETNVFLADWVESPEEVSK